MMPSKRRKTVMQMQCSRLGALGLKREGVALSMWWR